MLPCANLSTEVSSVGTLARQQRDGSCQTWQPTRCHVWLDTQDLNFRISQHQQTTIRHYVTSGNQTKQLQLATRSTQIAMSPKIKSTETKPVKKHRIEASIQTEAALPCRNSCTQTTIEEDEHEILSPHLKLLQLLLSTVSGQGQLLMGSVEAINQLVEFKALESQKQRLDANANAKATTEVKQLYSKSARLRCAKIRSRPKRNHRHRQQTELDREPQRQPTACKETQTEQLQEKVAGNLVAAKQRDRDKGFLWLRRNN
ncbi:hypothetical protein KR044_008557 [Drosophila immigrans]|nr:hypothetical protein KR044_008557 [Drosophila immigrans]